MGYRAPRWNQNKDKAKPKAKAAALPQAALFWTCSKMHDGQVCGHANWIERSHCRLCDAAVPQAAIQRLARWP